MNILLILFGRLFSAISRYANMGSGSTWPGHIALNANKNFIKDTLSLNKNLKIILIAGTNGKTTTGKLIQTILEKNGKKVFQNESGANLVNGIASSLLLRSNILGKINYDYAVFEIDENSLSLILKEIPNPNFVILLNLFRDQLDRYGEVNSIVLKWQKLIQQLSNETILLLNADDPQIAYLTFHLKNVNVKYFGIDSKNKIEKFQHASDSTYCPNCGEKLTYNSVYFSHLGNWACQKCNFKHPQKTFTSSPIYPLSGAYNEYNTNAATLLAQELGFDNEEIKSALKDFKPAFGRQEILNINEKKVQIFLSKNPTGFNESLRTVNDLGGKNILIILNDRIPDGRDVSWIWDIDMEEHLDRFSSIIVSGDRVFDMGLRLKYSFQTQSSNVKTYENLREAINESLKLLPKNEALYILPTYSAMLEVRKILTGKKIL